MEDSSSVVSFAEDVVQTVAELPLLLSEELDGRPKPRPRKASPGPYRLQISPHFLFVPVDLELYRTDVPGESSRRVTSIVPFSAPKGTLLQPPKSFKLRLEANPKCPQPLFITVTGRPRLN